MTAAQFRRIALRMPEAVEASHMGHPDFRINKKIFATLGYPTARHGVVMLTPAEQKRLLRSDSGAFAHAIETAWRRRAPMRLRQCEIPKKAPRSGRTHPNAASFPAGLSGPALRALATAGIRSARDLEGWSAAELLSLHGMGPKGVRLLKGVSAG